MDMGPPSIWRWADPRNEDELALEMDRFRVSALEVTLFQMETHYIPLLPGIHIGGGLCEPVAKVLPLSAGHP